MLRIAIAEDEPAFARKLEEHLRRFAQEEQIEIHVDTFPNGATLVERYTAEWDLLLLDVDMPAMNGIDTARSIRRRDADVLIMFITNLAQYAIQGYEVDALDYVLKPVSYYSLAMKLKKAARILRGRTSSSIILSQDGDMVRLPLSRLYFVEVYGHQLRYHTADGELLQTGARSLGKVEKELEQYGFTRCHNGYLVNLRFVEAVTANDVLVAGERLPISRHRRKEFLQALLNETKGGGPA